MKTIKFIGIICFVMVAFAVQATIKNETYGLSTEAWNQLSPSAQKEIADAAQVAGITNQLETYGKWAGMGAEIGEGVRSSLVAVKDVSIELAKSDLGKVTMGLVIWKVAGRDFIQIAAGLLFAILSTTVIIISYFKTFKRKIVVKKSGFWLWGKREYEAVSSDHFWEYPSAVALMHVLTFLVCIGISCAIMFG